MTAFIPVNSALLTKTSKTDFEVTGAPKRLPPVKVGVSIVRLATNVSQTSVRADKSGTKSYADERLEKGRVLVHPRHVPSEDDVLTINGQDYVISGVRPVFAMDGQIDHYQVEL